MSMSSKQGGSRASKEESAKDCLRTRMTEHFHPDYKTRILSYGVTAPSRLCPFVFALGSGAGRLLAQGIELERLYGVYSKYLGAQLTELQLQPTPRINQSR
jgi:hypothetical protein